MRHAPVCILLACFLAVGYLNKRDVSDQVIAERRAQIEGCINQYGPGERWARTNPQECAPMVEAPNNVMIIPVGQ